MKKKPHTKIKTPADEMQPERHGRRRLAHGRLLRVYNAIRDGDYPNAQTLSEEIEVSAKTITRDIQFLQDTWNLPIEYDERRYGYYFTGPVKDIPTVKLTSDELASLCIARQLMEAHRGTPFEAELRSAFKKFTESMQNETEIRWDQLAAAVSFRINGCEVPVDPRQLASLIEAIWDQAEVEFTYVKPDNPAPAQRRAEPLHLVYLDHAWYLLSFDPRKKGYRTFALSRMSNLKRTARTFEERPDFKPEKLLGDSIGIYKGEKPQRVRLRAKGFATFLLKERRWHRSQRCKDIPGTNGSEVEVTMKVTITPELLRWIFSWVDEAEVLEPAILREQVRDKVKAMAETYGA